MSSISTAEAGEHFAELIDRVASGEEIIITRNNRPVARVIPELSPTLTQVQGAVAGLRALQEKIRQRTNGEPLTEEEVRSAREEGRG